MSLLPRRAQIPVPQFDERRIRTVRVRRAFRTAAFALAFVIVVVGVPLLIGLFAVEEPVTPQTTIPGPVTTTPGSLESFSWPRVAAGEFIYQPTGTVGGMPVASMDRWCTLCPVGVLPDGRALVMASRSERYGLLVFDPETGGWTSTSNTSSGYTMDQRPDQMVTLSDGRMLWSGRALRSGSNVGVLEVYDPASDSFTLLDAGFEIPESSVPVKLSDGRVVVVWSLLSGAIFDPSDDSVSAFGDPGFEYAHVDAVTLNDDRVLVLDGSDAVVIDPAADDFGFDPLTGRFEETLVRSFVSESPAVALLPDGRVLIAGGSRFYELGTESVPVADAEVFDPGDGSFSPVGPMLDARASAQAVALPDGRAARP